MTTSVSPADVGSVVVSKTGVDETTMEVKATASAIDGYALLEWQDKDGNIGPKVPVKDTDYEVDMGESKWVLHNGYYYYTDIVSPNESTEHLFDSITVVDGATPKGYALSVELLSQSIQAEGTNAKGEKPVQLAWGVTITEPTADNPAGSVTAYTPQP